MKEKADNKTEGVQLADGKLRQHKKSIEVLGSETPSRVNISYIAELGTPPRQQQFLRHGRWFDTAGQNRPFFW